MTSRRRSEPIAIAALAATSIAVHLLLRFALEIRGGIWGLAWSDIPLAATLALGGLPLVSGLLVGLTHRRFDADLLAGISIITSVVLGELLAGTLVVLMMSGGQALEGFAIRRASSALGALASRVPSVAHRIVDGVIVNVEIGAVVAGDRLLVFPHETCPVDGTVLEGHGAMDEAYLTGEPYVVSKTAGSTVLSGAINGQAALTIRADRAAVDSRYAQIMRVMHESEQRRPQIRRLADRLGAVYTPIALAVASGAWLASGDPIRFLSVLVVATPCPLLIAIPVGIIGSISSAARRGIVIKDPSVLERIDTCRTAIFDKTGTLTYGRPTLIDVSTTPGVSRREVLAAAASVERYSRHPLASAVVDAADAERIALQEAQEVSERPGEGLRGVVGGRTVELTSRTKLAGLPAALGIPDPSPSGGLECVVLIEGMHAATFRFRDEPRDDGHSFVRHLGPRHGVDRVLLVSGDRESEVRYLANRVGIAEIRFQQSPEDKLALVREETRRAPTIFVGDGINDAPALTAATVGIGFGRGSDVTAEAAGAVVLDSSLERVDELIHIGRRMRRIVLQSALGGMALSVVGMGAAAGGWLPPVAGAVSQELIDVLAVANALRTSFSARVKSDLGA